MAVPIRKEETNNIIRLSVVNGKLGVKPEVRYNKDGSICKIHPNKKAGESSTVYPFTEEEIRKMIGLFNQKIEEAPDNDKRKIAARNKMLFIIGVNLSLRASDLSSIKWNFFFDENMEFRKFYKIQPKKTRKTGKFVTLYFNDAIKKSIIEYIEQYPIKNIDDFIFASRKGGHLTEVALGRIIKEAAGELKIDKAINSHSLRKSFGYHVWHNAKDKEKALVMLMVIFNHSSVAITKQYIGVMGEEVEEVFNELNLGIDYI